MYTFHIVVVIIVMVMSVTATSSSSSRGGRSGSIHSYLELSFIIQKLEVSRSVLLSYKLLKDYLFCAKILADCLFG